MTSPAGHGKRAASFQPGTTDHIRNQENGRSDVAKPEWGSKRICQSCGAKFYDFGKTPIVCPACNATFDPEAVLKSRRGKLPVQKEKVKPAKSKADEQHDEAVMDDDDIALDEEESDDEALVEDASDLEEEDLEVEVESDDDKDN